MYAGPDQILIIRHAEKPPPTGPPPEGVKEDGSQHGHSLIVRGWQRAGALAHLFAADGLRPNAIFSPPAEGLGSDHSRPYETITPLAARLAITVDHSHKLGEEDALAAAVLGRPGRVLICWEHDRIPLIATALAARPEAIPAHWPDDRFDLIWVFDREPSGRYAFRQQPQYLLAGDADVAEG
jgi:broad specificity phosphatase PhoE